MPTRSNPNSEAQARAKVRYYDQGRATAKQARRKWTPLEDQLLLNKPADKSDVQLAAELGRPIMGIQVRRCKLLAAQKPA